MAVIVDDLRLLLTVQTIDSRLDKLKATVAALDTGAGTAAAYNKGKAEFDLRRTAMHKAQGELRDAELRLQGIEAKTEQVNKTMYGAGAVGARELKNLQMELDMLARQKGEAEEKVLIAMETAGEATTGAETLEAELTALAEKYRVIRATYKERAAELNKEITAAEAERANAAKPVPPALLARYDTIRSKKGGIGAAPIQNDGTCGGCHIKLNVGLLEAVRDSLAMSELCEYCGRILIPVEV